jgi:hypothetical protein
MLGTEQLAPDWTGEKRVAPLGWARKQSGEQCGRQNYGVARRGQRFVIVRVFTGDGEFSSGTLGVWTAVARSMAGLANLALRDFMWVGGRDRNQ